MGIGDIIAEKKKDLDAWMKKQSTPVEVAAYSAGSAVQGAPTTDAESGDHKRRNQTVFFSSFGLFLFVFSLIARASNAL